jgi:hypothetical protein
MDASLSGPPTSPLGDSLDVFVRREDAERFIGEVVRDQRELAALLRIEEQAGGGRRELDTSSRRTLPRADECLSFLATRDHASAPFTAEAEHVGLSQSTRRLRWRSHVLCPSKGLARNGSKS